MLVSAYKPEGFQFHVGQRVWYALKAVEAEVIDCGRYPDGRCYYVIKPDEMYQRTVVGSSIREVPAETLTDR